MRISHASMTAALLLGSGVLFLQHRVSDRLAQENAGLQRTIQELEVVENHHSEAVVVQSGSDEIQDLRRQNAELQRLRGEVGMLRQRIKELEAASTVHAGQPNGRTGKLTRQGIFEKLDRILLSEVIYDGVPLSQVVLDLNEQSRGRDPDEVGVSFWISPRASDGTLADLSQELVRLHLTNVRLYDVVDAVCKVLEGGGQFAVDNDGVVIMPKSAIPELFTRVFRLDPAVLLKEFQGIDSDHSTTETGDTLEQGLRSLFLNSGVSFPVESIRLIGETVGPLSEPAPQGKAFFLNKRTGLLLVNASMEDLDIVEKAVAATAATRVETHSMQ